MNFLVMYWNDTMARKARMMVAKLRRKSRVRPYREKSEITPLLAPPTPSKDTVRSNGVVANGVNGVNGHTSTRKMANGTNGTTITINNQLYPIEEDEAG